MSITKSNFIKLKELKERQKELNALLKENKDEISSFEEVCFLELKKADQTSLKLKDVGVFTLSEKREFYLPSKIEDKKKVFSCLQEILGKEGFLNKICIMHTVFNSLINKMQEDIEAYNIKYEIPPSENRDKGVKMVDMSEKEKDKEKAYSLKQKGERLINLNPFFINGITSSKIKQSIKITKK